MAVETSAGNTEEDINFEIRGRGECMPNLRGASPVGRDEGGRSYVIGTIGTVG